MRLLSEVIPQMRCASIRNRTTHVSSTEYEAGVIKSETGVIFLQPLGTGHATIPHIKAMDVPFHLIYSSLICAKRLQSDRQNKVGCLLDPRNAPNMIIKYLSVGQLSKFIYQQVALNVLFQMRYDSLLNSN